MIVSLMLVVSPLPALNPALAQSCPTPTATVSPSSGSWGDSFTEELRRAVEGKAYDTLEAKVAAIEAELRKWDADAYGVHRLANWDWIKDDLKQLSNPNPIAA
jgi:hypothetical protein